MYHQISKSFQLDQFPIHHKQEQRVFQKQSKPDSIHLKVQLYRAHIQQQKHIYKKIEQHNNYKLRSQDSGQQQQSQIEQKDSNSSGSGNNKNKKVLQSQASFEASIQNEKYVSPIASYLQNFGFGRKSVYEGAVGLFIIVGIGCSLIVLGWARGLNWNKRKSYKATIQFPFAAGINVGTTVRVRGIPVGTVLKVDPKLDRVDVLTEINSDQTIIPKSSEILANQSGLIGESLIEITPRAIIDDFKNGPLDEQCESEGKIVCHKGSVKGEKGVSLDDLVLIMTRMTQAVSARGIGQLGESFTYMNGILEETKPLVGKIQLLVTELTPILGEIKNSKLVDNMEVLTRSASDAIIDIQKLQNQVLDQDNIRALRDSVAVLTKTVDNIEKITGNVGKMSGDPKVIDNLKSLLEAISRLVDD